MTKTGARLGADSPLTADQIRLIQTARRHCALSEVEYRELLRGTAGVDSSRLLRQHQFEAVLQRFKERGFEHRPRRTVPPHFGHRLGMASDAQITLIRELWSRYTGTCDERALQRWLERFHHVSSLRFLSARVAQVAIESLKVMAARKAAAGAGSGNGGEG